MRIFNYFQLSQQYKFLKSQTLINKVPICLSTLSLLLASHSVYALPAHSKTPLSQAQVKNVNAPVVGYVLLDNNTINTMLAAPKPAVDRIIFAFLNPGMDPAAVNADKVGSTQYMADIGLSGIDYQNLSALIKKLQHDGIQVFFSVGGWLYSEAPGDAQNGSRNFGIRTVTSAQIPELRSGVTLQASNYPFTSDMQTIYASLNLPYEASVESVAQEANKQLSTDDFTNTWIKVAHDFGVSGLDLDYEENWYSEAYTSIAPHYADWRPPQNGPVENTYSSVKFGVYLHSLEANAKNNGLLVSIAAPAIGAFDIHQVTQGDFSAGNWYWNNGVGSGTLKGVLYDVANYANITGTNGPDPDFSGHVPQFASIFTLNGNNILSSQNLNEIGVMTYDLDDGYQNHPYDNTSESVNSDWCIGWNSNGHPVSRDTKATDAGDATVDCAISSQVQAIMKSYQTALQAFPVNLHFGIEAAYPNYPINISSQLTGGGNDTTDSRYRWNDPYLPFTIPLTSSPNISNFSCSDIRNIVNDEGGLIAEMPYCASNTGNFTPAFFNLNSFLSTMKELGGSINGVIVWSLYNQEYQQTLLADLNNPNKSALFSDDYAGYSSALSTVLQHAATGQQILTASCQAFGSCNSAVKKHS